MESTGATSTVPTITLRGRELTIEQAAMMVRRSSGWFYWIAGLSVLNWLAIALDLNVAMIIGLGVTQLVSAVAVAGGREAEELRWILMLVSLIVALVAAGAFVFLGYHARKARLWAQITGAALYGLDAAIFLWVRDWIAVGFHAFVLVMLWSGISTTYALREARTRETKIGALVRS